MPMPIAADIAKLVRSGECLGSVRRFDNAKGWGAIESPPGKGGMRVHHSAIQVEGFRTLFRGEPVAYKVYHGINGAEAMNVRPLQPAPGAAPSFRQPTDVPQNEASEWLEHIRGERWKRLNGSYDF